MNITKHEETTPPATAGKNLASFLKDFKQDVVSKLDTIIKNQQWIAGKETELGNMITEFYRSNSKINNNYTGGFYIPSMTDAQAKSLLKQGISPLDVSKLSNNKFTVKYLVDLLNK